MLEFERIAGPHGDGMSTYQVQLAYTVRELMADVLTNRRGESGRIYDDNKNLICSYKWGKIEQGAIPTQYKYRKIISICAIGGWRKMDYYLKLE